MNVPEHYESDMLSFFAGRPLELELYQALYQALTAAHPQAAVKVQRTQISFYSAHLFAMVSHPRRRGEQGLVVSFGLGRRVDSPRIAQAVEPYPGRWTHHAALTRPEEVDGEVLAWLEEAWAFSQAKRSPKSPASG